ncbi:HD-GYP domain-containing protein [Bdellovibrio svalbardensis]|uniref:HD domain-containing protein n=1 Tax=Bdellovibrio svalbardensis TaxID=2972972 RepID=A0ABT6DMX5_9BACT|nr:HD domain-containing phosphohydrolase [Bdellovibrio svalbardensis]MDG0818227.1 HD domain-containing protein [Bdellovibrio svalbardensis]
MSENSGKTVDVIVGSSRKGFLETIKSILSGFYPYKLQFFSSVDELLDHNPEGFKPILAIIDGQDGTQKTNEWVQSAKMNNPDCPLIVLHSAEASLDFNVVKKNGASEVMHINFDREFITDMVLQLAPIEMDGDHIPITALMPVDLRDIEAGVNINFDVYVHLPANCKSIIMRRAGDVIDQRHVDKFKAMRQQMYIKKTQTKEFFEYARTIMSMRNIPLPISMTEKFHRSMKTIYDFMGQFLNGAATDYAEGKIIYDKCKSIVLDLELNKTMSPSEIYDEVCRYAGNNRTYYHDCICVAAYAAYFAQLLDWSPEKRESAAIAGLLHNIGLAQLPATIAVKPMAQMNAEELKEYQRYPDRSIVMVKSKKVPISQEISDAIGQHRETIRGKGFPKGLKSEDITDFGKLLGIAYQFHEMTALQEGKGAVTPVQALTNLKENALTGEAEVDLILSTQIFKRFKA